MRCDPKSHFRKKMFMQNSSKFSIFLEYVQKNNNVIFISLWLCVSLFFSMSTWTKAFIKRKNEIHSIKNWKNEMVFHNPKIWQILKQALCWFISSIINLWFLESDVLWTSVKTKHCCWHLFCQSLNTYDEFYELKPPKSKSQLLILIFFSSIFSNDYTKIVNFSSYFLFHWLIEESHFVKKIHDPKHWIFK